MRCKCGKEIEPERLEAIPDADKCIACAIERDMHRARPQGFMIPTSAKGTAPVLIRIDPEDEEALRLARRAHFRSR